MKNEYSKFFKVTTNIIGYPNPEKLLKLVAKNPMTIEESQDSIIEINSLPINKQYYTPNIEDFYKGYEYEFHSMTIGGIMYMEPDENHKDITPYIPVFTKQIFTGKIYRKGSMDAFDDTTLPLDFLIELLEKGSIRIKFLDKEDIESLGWILVEGEFMKDKSLNLNCIDCFKVKYKLKIEQENIRIEKYSYGGFMGNRTYEQIYLGSCKSINELKIISKLLNIK